MNRKEMIPAPDRKAHHSIGLCNPEWQLLCWIRRELKLVKGPIKRGKLLRIIKDILVTMDDTFSDWPEDPK